MVFGMCVNMSDCLRALSNPRHSIRSDVGERPIDLMRKRNLGMHSEKSVSAGRAFSPRPTDVFVVTYPKCGTTWMTQICHQLRTGGHDDFEEISCVCPWDIVALDVGQDLDADQIAEPRIFKSHERAPDIAKGGRYIHVCRDPFDAFVSFYRFLPAWAAIPDGAISPEEFAEAIFGGASHSGGIWDFFTEWWARRGDQNVLWVCYEDLHSNLREQLVRIARFMGVPTDEERLRAVEEKCSFAYMQARSSQFDEHVVFGKLRDQMCIPKDYVFGTVNVSKVRKGGGVVGEGKSAITEHVRQMLHQRWKITIEEKIGFASYADMRRAVSE
eukprot:TRINITY_DN69490_c0_g1_i1.p1 TRINITY_DN69490_c0_g1~~TRINITY_DN69490_c0_g1_i1.p1  ORF type:complete len:328 (-),score=51.98 TRINITY_DN69490_c0_g1_i1:44-1027(-)